MIFVNKLVTLNTFCKKCLIKRYITKDKNATHTNNVIYFVVNPKDASITQSCFNTTYCMEQTSQKHRKFKIGFITDKSILNLFAEWCKDNDWNFNIPIHEVDEWLGGSDSE